MKEIILNFKSTTNFKSTIDSSHRKIEVTDQDGNPIKGITSVKYDCTAPFTERCIITIIPGVFEVNGIKAIIDEPYSDSEDDPDKLGY